MRTQEHSMTLTRRDGLKLMGAAALSATPIKALAASHEPTEHVVEMMNKSPETGERMVFEPDLVRAMPGDTIRFVPTEPGHNSVSNDDMMPEGGTAWKGKINAEVSVTLETEGAYGFHCVPHRSTGMVGLVLVGDVSSNYETARSARQRGKAAARYDDIFARADALLASEST
jgi:pseudoazurin